MKTICPPSYHYNGFVATHALGHMMYDYTLLVPMNQRVLKSHRYVYKYVYKSHRYIYICLIYMYMFEY